jgi:hypothetical protein
MQGKADIETELADAQIALMQLSIEDLVNALDDETTVTDKSRLAPLLEETSALLLQIGEWKGQYLQSLNGNGHHYVDMLDQQKVRLEEIRRSYS